MLVERKIKGNHSFLVGRFFFGSNPIGRVPTTRSGFGCMPTIRVRQAKALCVRTK